VTLSWSPLDHVASQRCDLRWRGLLCRRISGLCLCLPCWQVVAIGATPAPAAGVHASCHAVTALRSHVVRLTQAHAASRPGAVSLYYAAPSALSAAYIQEWDNWRDNGVRLLRQTHF